MMPARDPAAAAAASGAGDESPADLRRRAAEFGLEWIGAEEAVALDPALVAGLPVEWARARAVLPVRKAGEVVLLTADPSDVSSLEYVALLLDRPLVPVLAPRALIARCIDRCYFSREDTAGDFLRDLRAGAPAAAAERPRRGAEDLLAAAEKTPVTQLVNLILLEAVKRGASDIHFEPFLERLRVRYRIDGVLHEQESPPKPMEEALVSRLKVMAHMDIAEKRLPQDGTARVRVGEREIDIRVSTVPVAEGERVVLRLLDRQSALLPLARLGMPDDVLQPFERLLGEPNGMIVVAGPTGSGKTTTLYAALGRLDATHRNILTVEDPIEYQLPNIGQIQVKPKIGLSFAEGLRHILRQDPDIVLVGEVRDLETAEIAVRASLTGHLVFTTLHTNDAVSSVLRLADMGVKPYLISACLRGVLAQRLVRTLCRACAHRGAPDEADRRALRAVGAEPPAALWTPRRCAACLDGYRGRTGLFELMTVDEPLGALMRSCEGGLEPLREAARRAGMRTLLDDGLRKVAEGVTSLAEVLGVAT